jgi:hypothetical protein
VVVCSGVQGTTEWSCTSTMESDYTNHIFMTQ